MKKTATAAVLAANERNAQKSTGPRSTSAKNAVKHNAIKHGLLTKTMIFASDEEKTEFENMLQELDRDFRPSGTMQRMLVEDIAVSWWKLHRIQRLQMEELRSRQKAAAAILETFAHASEEVDGILSERPENFNAAARFGWECREPVLRAGGAKSEEEKGSGNDAAEKRGRITFEAKLGNSAETILRYESAWKKNLYRAIATLQELRVDRRQSKLS